MNLKCCAFFILASLLVFLTLSCDVRSRSADDAKEQTEQMDENSHRMQKARDNYDQSNQRVAQLREQAVKLRMSGTAADNQKADELEREAAKIEQSGLNGLNPGNVGF